MSGYNQYYCTKDQDKQVDLNCTCTSLLLKKLCKKILDKLYGTTDNSGIVSIKMLYWAFILKGQDILPVVRSTYFCYKL